ncbi:MAG: preprotein translocase subunit YajC [Gemmataceae bacterium]
MLLALLTLFADGDPAPTPAPGGGMGGMMPMILLMMLAFFFIFVLPMRRQKKQQEQLMSSIKPRDKVVTSGGIVGIVHQIPEKKDDQLKEDEVVLRMDDNAAVKIRVLRSSIVRIFPSDTGAATATPEKK